MTAMSILCQWKTPDVLRICGMGPGQNDLHLKMTSCPKALGTICVAVGYNSSVHAVALWTAKVHKSTASWPNAKKALFELPAKQSQNKQAQNTALQPIYWRHVKTWKKPQHLPARFHALSIHANLQWENIRDHKLGSQCRLPPII